MSSDATADTQPPPRSVWPAEIREQALRRIAAGERQSDVAVAMKIPESTLSTWRSEVGAPKRASKPKIDHAAREERIQALHAQGFGTYEIARQLGLHSKSISKVKAKLGIAANSEGVRLNGDIERVVASLEGWACGADNLAERVEGSQLSFNEVEIRRCLKSLSESARTVGRLRNALKQKLQP